MADGDKIDHYIEEDQIQTTDATTASVVEVTIPTGTDGILAIFAWCHGSEADGTDGMHQMKIAQGAVDAGAVTVAGDTSVALSDPATKGWTIAIDAGTGVVRLRVTGGGTDTVRWHGSLSIHFRELAIT